MSSSNERTRALSLGAVDYLRKPVCNQALVALTRRLLHDTPRAVPATILVVDDEPDTVDLLHVTLAAQGWRVLSAYDGPQALALLERERPGLILLDLMLPGLSGFEVLEALGRDDETARIPVVVLSARGDDASVRRGLALGARRFLSKPFELRALVAEVQRQLAAGTRPRATSAS
jgi:two-component system phosphate regulon response regulator PhoB